MKGVSMMKKLIGLSVVVALGLGGTAMALDVYSGANLGANFFTAKKDLFSNGFGGKTNVTPASRAVGVIGGVYAGVGMNWNKFYLAAELGFSYNSAATEIDYSLSSPSITGKVKESVKPVGSLSILPAYMLSENDKVFARIGGVYGNFSNKLTGTYVNNQGYSGNFNQGVYGLILGLGCETQIAKNITVRAEFDHTNFESFTKSNRIKDPQNPTQPENFTVKFHPESNQFTLGVSYHFGGLLKPVSDAPVAMASNKNTMSTSDDYIAS